MKDDVRPVRRALVSVSDKSRLEELAAAFAAAHVEVVSTGSTAARLRDAGLEVISVEVVTGFAECLDGRVKTLHPRVHAGLLADLRRSSHRDELAKLGIAPYDLLVSSLYPFTETVGSGATPEECIEQIDIGGPALVRAAAKNYANLAVVSSSTQYDELLTALSSGGFTERQRHRLAAEAFAAVAAYDVEVARWFATRSASEAGEQWPRFTGRALRLGSVLRYGENAHQPAALYLDEAGRSGWCAPSSCTASRCRSTTTSTPQLPTARRTTSSSPRSRSSSTRTHAASPSERTSPRRMSRRTPATRRPRTAAWSLPNRPVTAAMARQLRDVFTEVLVAPAFEPDALALLSAKKNLRILRADGRLDEPWEGREISGGVLVQATDRFQAEGDDPRHWRLVCGDAVGDAELRDLAFAWRACRSVKSNAVVLAAETATVGVGMGQVNRVDAARLAVARAGERAEKSLAASDAFFPFPDGLIVLLQAGVRAVVQPGGSVRDEEVIAAAEAAGVPMYFTGSRHFAH